MKTMGAIEGRLFLIPTPLGDGPLDEVIPAGVLGRATSLNCFVVEEIRTARRFLSGYGLKGHIGGLEFHVLNEHTTPDEVEALLPLFDKGDVGLMSEAGLPAVADPGSNLIALCHRKGIQVIPLVGPSSLMMALMASGLDGQSFAFKGYLPAKTDERRNAIREIERQSRQLHQTQIFIETPYRNDSMLADLLEILSPGTELCIAADITLPSQYIRTAEVSKWRKDVPVIGKRPCVFIIAAV